MSIARPGVRKIYRYSEAFKATTVGLSQLPGAGVQSVATSLDVHPFLLSRWRRIARVGKLVVKHATMDDTTKAQLQELRNLRGEHAPA